MAGSNNTFVRMTPHQKTLDHNDGPRMKATVHHAGADSRTECWHSSTLPRHIDTEQPSLDTIAKAHPIHLHFHHSSLRTLPVDEPAMELCVDTITESGHIVSAPSSASPLESSPSNPVYSFSTRTNADSATPLSGNHLQHHPQRPSGATRRAKFFVCESEDESEGDDVRSHHENISDRGLLTRPSTLKRSGRTTSLVNYHHQHQQLPQQQFHRQHCASTTLEPEHYHDGDCEDNVEGQLFIKMKRTSSSTGLGGSLMPLPNPTFSPIPNSNNDGNGRRHSLLSDLFIAEKRQKQIQRDQLQKVLDLQIPSAPNSDGESSTPTQRQQNTPPMHLPQRYPGSRDRREPPYGGGGGERERLVDNVDSLDEPLSRMPLRRTKKVFKNLAELTTMKEQDEEKMEKETSSKSKSTAMYASGRSGQASLSSPSLCTIISPTTTTTTCTFPASPILSTTAVEPSSSSNSSTSTTGWTVQVQIQAMVAQSTSSAQRALKGASAALADALFRMQ